MSIFIQETGRSFPNVDDGGEYKKTWQRPDNGDYESHAHHSGPGPNYRITFNEDGPGSTAFGADKVFYIVWKLVTRISLSVRTKKSAFFSSRIISENFANLLFRQPSFR